MQEKKSNAFYELKNFDNKFKIILTINVRTINLVFHFSRTKYLFENILLKILAKNDYLLI